MGAWSHEPFGNDDAVDWSYDLVEAKDLKVVETAIKKALVDPDDYLEAPDASEAIAAVEVIVKLLGKGTQKDAYTEKVDVWVSSMRVRPDPKLIARAHQALTRIRGDNSELHELWQESEEFPAWEASLKELAAALD